ncbi:MAG TPA: serine/threonine protein kinase [Pyrinomonadaceae bacterium]|nr:serine/threonine protein kinase [Pyrinomonadaceae bacterium]
MTELKLQNCRLDGRYDVQDCLGRGSYAEIYVARDRAAVDGMPPMVVIKALNVFLQGTPDVDLERTLIENFQNEAVALDRVRHPNIISRLGHGTAIDLSGTTFHYLVLEYMSGGDLATLCRIEPLKLKDVLFYIEQVSAGLAHAHRCGVIHRDIKPQNLLLSADRQIVKIADFGVAKLEATEGIITRVGTNVYAAPEHNPVVQTGALDLGLHPNAQPGLTPAADIFSLAKTVYTLLTGSAPRRFSHRQITDLPEEIARHEWAPSLLRVLRRATEMRPEARYQTVQEFWDELSDAALPPTRLLQQPGDNGGGGHARPTGSLLETSDVPNKTTPPRPRFNSSQELKEANVTGKERPRIVVRVAEDRNQTAPVAPRQKAHEIIEGFSDAPVVKQRPQQQPAPPARLSGRWARLLVAVLLVLAFAGMLLATHNYFRGRWPLWRAGTTPATSGQRDAAGREGVVNTRAYIRNAPVISGDTIITIVEKGARVRVLSVSDDDKWYEVEATSTVGTTNTVTRGWMGKKVIDLAS